MAQPTTPAQLKPTFIVDRGFARGACAARMPKQRMDEREMLCRIKRLVNNSCHPDHLLSLAEQISTNQSPPDPTCIRVQILEALQRGDLNLVLPLAQQLAYGK